MAAFSDLSILWSGNTKCLHNKLHMATKLGYKVVAIDYQLDEFPTKAKKGKQIASIKPANDVRVDENVVEEDLQMFTRITACLSNPNDGREIQKSEAIQSYDILAVRPTTEKLFHMACTEMEVDIISLDLTQKLPFYFRRQSIIPALKRGVHFELTYAPMIRDATARRNILSTALSLISVCKGKDMELRGPYDLANLGLLFDLSAAQAKDTVCTNCRDVLLHSRARKTAKCVLSIRATPTEVKVSDEVTEVSEDETAGEPTSKKQKR